MSTIFVNADWSAVVPEGSPEAAFGVQPRDAKRLGVDKLPIAGGAELPDDLPEPETLQTLVLRSASLAPEEPAESTVDDPDLPEAPVVEAEPEADKPEAKAAPKPADKAATKPANKAATKPATR